MKKTAVALLTTLFVLAPFSAFAADADLRIRGIDGRTLTVRYANFDDARMRIETKEGRVVMDRITLPKRTGTKTITLPKDITAGSYTLVVYEKRSQTELARASFTLSYPTPTCAMKANEKAFERGEMLRIRWSSENAESAVLFGNKKVSLHGSERISLYHAGTRSFALNVLGKGGVASCSVTVRVSE